MMFSTNSVTSDNMNLRKAMSQIFHVTPVAYIKTQAFQEPLFFPIWILAN